MRVIRQMAILTREKGKREGRARPTISKRDLAENGISPDPKRVTEPFIQPGQEEKGRETVFFRAVIRQKSIHDLGRGRTFPSGDCHKEEG